MDLKSAAYGLPGSSPGGGTTQWDQAMKDIELPPLPEPTALGMDFDKGWDGVRAYGYTEEDLQAYARAAVEADRAQRVPDGWKQEAAEAIDWLLNNIRRDAPQLSGKAMGNAVRVRDALLASTPAPAQQEPSDENKALDLLAVLFDSYENGTPCYEDPESTTGYLGHAFQLDSETFHACADLLNRRRPVNGEPAAQPQEQPAPAQREPAKPMDAQKDAAIDAAIKEQTR